MALDSLYCSYLKAHYPYEFYQVLLQFHSDRGEKDKVAALKCEMKEAFGITEGAYKFGADNRKFVADKTNRCIYPALRSLKGFNDECAESLYQMYQTDKPTDFIDFLRKRTNYKGIDSGRLEALIKINYFSEFGTPGYLLNLVDLYDAYAGKKLIKKEKLSAPPSVIAVIEKYSTQTEKQYRITDPESMLNELAKLVQKRPIPVATRINWEKEFLGYAAYTDTTHPNTWVVLEIDTKYSPKLSIYELATGRTVSAKLSKRDYTANPVSVGSTIRLTLTEKPKVKKVDDKWVEDPVAKDTWIKCYSTVTI